MTSINRTFCSRFDCVNNTPEECYHSPSDYDLLSMRNGVIKVSWICPDECYVNPGTGCHCTPVSRLEGKKTCKMCEEKER